MSMPGAIKKEWKEGRRKVTFAFISYSADSLPPPSFPPFLFKIYSFHIQKHFALSIFQTCQHGASEHKQCLALATLCLNCALAGHALLPAMEVALA